MPDIGAEQARIDVLGVKLLPQTMSLMLERIRRAVETRTKLRAAFCSVHGVIECQDNPELAAAINGCQVVATDGMPLVWLCRLRGAKGAERVYGPDTMLACCEDGLARGYRHYFFGSTELTLEALARRLGERFPGLIIAGSYAPPFRALTAEEDAEVVARINAAKPDIVWVGLGMPKQDLWAAAHQDVIGAPVILAVGAAFDFHAGVVRQAPRWIQRSGAEWIFRLSQEPGRLWRRYLLGNTRFLLLLVRDVFGRR